MNAFAHIMRVFHDHAASDLFLTVGFPPAMRVEGSLMKITDSPLTDEDIDAIIASLLTESQQDDFSATMELNFVTIWEGIARLRVNVFRQMHHNALAIRRVITDIPTVEQLGLPDMISQLIMKKRGLILVVGQTGSGKSTTLAAMIGHRNQHGTGHIITIEDPIEFVHVHKNCIISQRDVGIDTYSYGMALKNALRQTPDVILIGEIRDRETMEHAIAFAETGHLCVSTLHSNNANQAIERILNFFPVEIHKQVLANLSFNVRGIISQRLVPNMNGKRIPAIEILLNEGVIRDYIHSGELHLLKEHMEKNSDIGMQTFDVCLLEYFKKGWITEDTALTEADSPSNMRLYIKQHTSQKKLSHGFDPKAMIFGTNNDF